MTLLVHATAEGFLFLSDQWYPGWSAFVNAVSMPITRANYVFRLVRVPAGDSTVVFRYRPMSVTVGAAVSLITLLLLGGCAGARWWRGRRIPISAR